VASELKKIWKIRDESLRRKAIKALYFKWHPDKNPHRFATQVFQYIQQQIERLEHGLDITLDSSEGETGFTSPSWTRTAWRWEEEVRTQRESGRREQERRRTSTEDDWDDLLNQTSVSPDPRTAQVWLKQAEHDLTALQALVREANIKKEVCAHACFMAHQVAEKGLKAGMYKVIGLDPNVLRWHQLIGHASAIEQVTEPSGLRAMARTLESYYLDPRYPNRYNPVRVPSDQYTIEDAFQAEETAKNIVNIIQKLF
jgi:sacsin